MLVISFFLLDCSTNFSENEYMHEFGFREGWEVERFGRQVRRGAHRSKITKKVHKPPQNHYIEWPVFSDIGLDCESQGEKGRTCEK